MGLNKETPDIVEYVEKIYAYPLLDYQKEFIRKTYDSLINNKQLCCILPRGAVQDLVLNYYGRLL